MYMYACLYMYVCILYLCAYMYACICMRVYLCVCMFVCMYVCMYICVYAYMYMYVCIIHMYVGWGIVRGEMSYPKWEGELSGGELSGRIVRGNCPTLLLQYRLVLYTSYPRHSHQILQASIFLSIAPFSWSMFRSHAGQLGH